MISCKRDDVELKPCSGFTTRIKPEPRGEAER